MDEENCSYCGRLTWRTTGRLHIANLKGTLINFDKEIDINIVDETFCDSDCLHSRIMDHQWLNDAERDIDTNGKCRRQDNQGTV